MAETKFKITLNETGQTMTRTLIGNRIAFFNHKWSYDKEGKEVITKAELSETVYFHTEITGLPTNSDLKFKLYDHDNFFRDGLDDDKFTEEEIEIDTQIIEENGVRKASIELYLDEKWEKMLKEDSGYDLELYWEVHFKLPNYDTNLRVIVPKKEDERLEVEFNSRTLFFKPAIAGGKLPQLIANDGSPLFLAKLKDATIEQAESTVKKEAKKKLKKKAQQVISNAVGSYNTAIEGKSTTIALTKLAKGNMIDTHGKIHTKSRNIHKYTEQVFGKEVIVQRGKHFGNNKVKSASNQAHFFATNGEKVEILNAMRIQPLMSAEDASKTFSKLFDLVKFSMSDLDEITSQPLSVPALGTKQLTKMVGSTATLGISLWIEFLGYIALKEHKKLEAIVDEIMNEKLEVAKTEGYKAVDTFLKVYDTDYILVPISSKTLSELLIGKFKTLNEVTKYDKMISEERKVELLIKVIEEEEKIEETTVIETIFFID